MSELYMLYTQINNFSRINEVWNLILLRVNLTEDSIMLLFFFITQLIAVYKEQTYQIKIKYKNIIFPAYVTLDFNYGQLSV